MCPVPVRAARSGLPLLVVAGVLWGCGGLIGAAFGAATGLAPVAVAAYRLGAGGALLAAWLLATRRRALLRWATLSPTSRAVPSRAAVVRVVATGALAALFQASYFGALAHISVGLATFVAIGTAPLVVLVVERVRGHRAPGRVVAGGGLALFGLALLVGAPASGPEALVGAALAVVAGSGFGLMTLLAARPVAGLDPATTTGIGFLLGGLLLVPFAAAGGAVGFAPTPTALGLLAALGVVPTALAYAAYFTGLRTAPAGVAALLALLEPLTAAGLAAAVLGERLTPVQLVGAALLTVALVLVGSATGQAPRPRPR